MTSTSMVRVNCKDYISEEAACGDGPVDAIFNAIDRATGKKVNLDEYSIKASTGGNDALGEVTVRISDGNLKAVGYGVSTDIIEASAKAYINAINNLESKVNEMEARDIKGVKLKHYNFFGEGVEANWEFEAANLI
jgi:2-isopropylmalate synthase